MFLKLTRPEATDLKVSVNMDQVRWVSVNSAGQTVLAWEGGIELFFVTESPEQIMEMMKGDG